MKIKHSVSSLSRPPPATHTHTHTQTHTQSLGAFFVQKKFCMGEQAFLDKFRGRCFIW